MTQRDQETQLERAIARAFARGRYTRRAFLGRTGKGLLVAGSALTLPSILAACGIGPQASPSPGGSPAAGNGGDGTLQFANWPFYIDQDDETAESDTLNQFEEETGTSVNYREVIEDNDGFFGTIQPTLAAGQSTGWDLMVLTDWMIAKMIRLGYLQEINVDADVPNFVANAADKYKDPSYDPGNAHSVPWASGFTGIGYNISLTGREITSLDDLWNPEFEGRIGMFREMRDSMNFGLLRLGIDPTEATDEDAERAQAELLEQAPLVRNYYGNEYTDALAHGDVALTMAWSGDVYQLQLENEDLRFVIPQEGGNLWIDNMCIPNGAANPDAAKQMMDFVFQPEIAAQMAAYIQFICPVPGAQEIIAGDEDEEVAALAESELIFPSDATLAQTYGYPNLDEEREERWQELFQAVVQG